MNKLYDEIRQQLEELQAIAKSAGNSALADRADGLKKRVQPRDFRVAFVGEFKAGKTTLVNGLCRRDLLPVSTRECTAVVTRIRSTRAKETEGVTLTLEGGSQHKAEVEELEGALSVKGGRIFKRKKVEDAEIRLSSWPWSDLRVELVDTPGVNAAANVRDKTVLEYLPNADALVFVTRADQLLSETELAFLKNSVVREDLSKLFLVINRADTLKSSADRLDVEKRARDLLNPIVDGEVRIHFTAAQDFQDGLEDSDSELMAESGVPQFEDVLRAFLREERLGAELAAYRRTTSGLIAELTRNLERISVTASLGADRIKDRASRYERAISALSNDLERTKGEVKTLVENLVGAEISTTIDAQMQFLRSELEACSESSDTYSLASIARDRVRSSCVAIESSARRGVKGLKANLQQRIESMFDEVDIDLDKGVPELAISSGKVDIGSALRVKVEKEAKKTRRLINEGATEGLAVLGFVVGALTGGIGAIILGGLLGGATGAAIEKERWDVEEVEKRVVKGIPQTVANARDGLQANAKLLLNKLTEGQVSVLESVFRARIAELEFESRQFDSDDPAQLEVAKRESAENLRALEALNNQIDSQWSMEMV